MPLSGSSLVEVMAISGLDRTLVYRIPDAFSAEVRVGSLVRIPLRNRQEMAIISRMGSDQDVPPAKIKNVLAVVQPLPVLTPDLLHLARWLMTYYNASAESVLETMIPTAIRRGMRPKTQRYLMLAKPLDADGLTLLQKRAPRQAQLLEFLAQQQQPIARTLVLQRLGLSASVCDALVRDGHVREQATREMREAYEDELGDFKWIEAAGSHSLTDEQASAVTAIEDALQKREFSVRLLHGVTGSGKTEVYLRAVERILAEPKGGVLILVPEVALAPQTVGRVRARFEARDIRTVVWHSHLSAGERYDAWHALASGEARVVVGARSAVFAPVQHLRLIIVDEEHEPAYKQDEAPRYNGRDVAVYRAQLSQAVCVLASATPSLESLYNVTQGKYAIDRILNRVDNRSLPRIHVVDMRREHAVNKAVGPISSFLADHLRDRLEKKEQSILFINRRGFATSLLCPDCGHVPQCDHCSIPLTYHRTDDRLRCHLCGYETKAPADCPECHSRAIRRRGHGTQRIEDVVQKILPHARIVRMDADSMSRKNLHRRILNDFRVGKIDILVGTQMIAKGLDFPNVTLVGLVDADQSLHIEDFRAAERTFQLIVQVSGRAGRGELAGEVVIQSHTPYSPPIQFARRGDFDGFQLEEMAQREAFSYPPFRHLIRHLFKGRNPEKVAFYAEQWTREAEKLLGKQVELRGPAPAPIEKIRDEYRYHLWYFCRNATPIVKQLRALRKIFPMDREVVDLIDVDPMNLS
jgi:primosomal protein N' (replication factor Y)